MFNRSKKVMAQFDWILLITTMALCAMGFVVVYSAIQSTGGTLRSLLSQFIATAIGFSAILVLQFVDTDALKKFAIPSYAIILVLLAATLVIGVGDVFGARAWLSLGPITFQPSEFSKIVLILGFAVFLERFQDRINKPLTIVLMAIGLGAPLLLILKQPDYGTAAVILFFIACMVFIAKIHWGYIVAAVAAAIVLAPILYESLSDLQKERILNFIDPLRDINGTGYQIYQGLIAIASGRVFGKGYMQGTQTHYGFIPERDTDYIFAVLTEEFGFIGGLVLIALYALLLYRMIRIAYRAKDTFSKTLVVGIAAMLFIHIFENIGMTIGLMPVTGIPLPFMSNGGTFQLLNLVCVGLVLSVSTQRAPLDFNTR
ncbi:MAG: rod shape-determining protein RodA [Peptoniphilaceae bacterium]|nr:rod shape-determining protein RodA [Peptoniphilaceae bacterium]MDY6086300.1 rod shape-determining protein RodA [Peptoniphilaceae bacterium]